jgi:hypothetical protein
MALDFKDIEPAQGGQASQEQFEIFAREFLACKGYRVVKGPGRGADGGADLIVEMDVTDGDRPRTIRYLVSCKHYAHSGKSVTPTDDSNISDRLVRHDCVGFIAFYSTVASQGLLDFLHVLSTKGTPVEVYDFGRIERELLESTDCHPIARRFMRSSFDAWTQSDPLYPAKARDAVSKHYAAQDQFDITTIHSADSVVELITARPGTEPTILTAQFKFHEDDDREAFEAFQRMIDGGHPVVISPKNIESREYHQALLDMFPELAQTDDQPMVILPVTIHAVETASFVIVSPDATEVRYPVTLTFDQDRAGIKERLLSNVRQNLPIVVKLVAGSGRAAISLSTQFGGFPVSAAFQACSFLSALITGDRIELRDPLRDNVLYTIRVDEDGDYRRLLPLYDLLVSIERTTESDLTVPTHGFDEPTLREIFGVSQLIGGKPLNLPSMSMTVRAADGSHPAVLSAHNQYVFAETFDNATAELLGTEISLGPTLRLYWRVRATVEPAEVDESTTHDDQQSATVLIEPTEDGFIRSYALRYCSPETLQFLREKLPADTLKELVARGIFPSSPMLGS